MMPRTHLIGLIAGLCALFIVAAGIFTHALSPVEAVGVPTAFEIQRGDGFREIAKNLHTAGLLRSPIVFETFAVLNGSAFRLKPGAYPLSPAMSALDILRMLASGGKEVTVTIPEGATLYDVDRILGNARVIQPGDILNAASASAFEGRLFPDTYKLMTYSNASAVIQKFLNNFDEKTKPLFDGNGKNTMQNLIIASLVQKEVSDSKDQMLIAGIIKKRLAAGMPLNIDATICYIKRRENLTSNCYPLDASDFKIASPYNTYLYQGLPPAPISNPGVGAIQAALHPRQSPYWYYLNDPQTGKTVYAITLEEQNANRAKYFGG